MSGVPVDLEQRVADAIRSVLPAARTVQLLPNDSLVLDLGLDSMKVALLALALEERLGRAILLERWISSCSDPARLSVESLHHYVRTVLADDDETAGLP
jgi:acyl carrier protein